MEKIWLKSYSPGVPAEINPDAYQSLLEVFDITCQKAPKHPAFYNLGTTLSYADVDRDSRHFAAYLQQQLKLKKGDRLAIMLPNTLQYPIVLFGALRAGVIVVNVNPLYTPDELTHQLIDCGATTIVVMANFADTVEKSLPRLPLLKNIIITKLGDLLQPFKGWLINFFLQYVHHKIPKHHIPRTILFKQTLSMGRTLTFTPIPIHNEDIAFLQYTGGTTGISKGAVLTHRNIVANIEQAYAWFKSLLVGEREIIITALPLYHIFSLMGNCLFFVKMGGLNVLITNPRDIPSILHEMKKFKFTAITGVNTLFNALLKHPSFAKLNFNYLRLALGGGTAVQQVVADKWQECTHAPLLEGYGLTETSPCVAISPVTQSGFDGTVGLPVPSTDIALFDDNHQQVPTGQAGELAVKGPQVMKCYWNNSAETAKVFTSDGWLLTGDIATVDDLGFVRIVERKKDMILVSGFNVYPNEIEDVIANIPGVREVAVIAVSDESSGEVPKAFIVKDNPDLTAEQIINYCAQHLTHYKLPKQIDFVNDLPKSNVGKILRRLLREKSS